jgi:hypothetical protein
VVAEETAVQLRKSSKVSIDDVRVAKVRETIFFIGFKQLREETQDELE